MHIVNASQGMGAHYYDQNKLDQHMKSRPNLSVEPFIEEQHVLAP